jgi:hypothetical protein
MLPELSLPYPIAEVTIGANLPADHDKDQSSPDEFGRGRRGKNVLVR